MSAPAMRRLAVIGHPLAAEENRLAFRGWNAFAVDLVAPAAWRARSLGHVYRTGPAPSAPGEAALHTLPTWLSGRNSLYLWRGLDELLARLRPDLIYCWEEPWCLSAWQIRRAARRLGATLVFYTAENRPKRLPWPFAALMRAVFREARACVAPTPEIADTVRTAGFTGRILAVPLWIRSRRPVRADAAARTLAYVGRLIPLKRVHLLVEALALLPGWRLRVIGDGPERGRLEALARSLGVERACEFRGHVDNADLERSLDGCTLLALPTGENARQAEQFGKAALEGVSCGLPVLASATGNLARLAESVPTLSARDLDTPAAMAEAVAALAADYPSRDALAEARSGIARRFGPEAAGRALEAAFAGLGAPARDARRARPPHPPSGSGAAGMMRSNASVRGLEDALMRLLLPLLRAGSAFGALRRRSGAPAGPRRALIVKWCCMGDAVVSLYAIREYKRRHPEASLEVLVSARIAAVYRGAPWIDAVHVLPVTGHRLARELASPDLWRKLAGLVFRLRGRRFAEMVDLELYRAHGALLKRLLGIPWSRGFAVEGALDKGHDFQVDLPRDMPEWKCFYRVLGLEPPEREPEPLYARAAARRAGKRIGMVYGSSFNWPQKKWPWEHFARLAQLLHARGHEVVLFGSALERGESRRIREAAGVPLEDTSGRLDYAGLLEAVAGCDLVVGNDTGTLHLAAACGVPTVTLFGPTDPRKWNPLTSTAVHLENLPCRPCYYLGSMPACGHFDCLRKLEPSLVAEKIRLRLAEEAASSAREQKSLFPGNGRA